MSRRSLFAAFAAVCSLVGGAPASAAQTAPAPAPPDPIVFVHGVHSDGNSWSDMRSWFQRGGYPTNRVFAMTYDSTQSNIVTAGRLAAYIRQVLRQTGATKVDIVAHSMGSLSSRWCIRFNGCGQMVDDWVSLGGPNHGTLLALGCGLVFPGEASCPEMAPGSSFLTALNRGDETPGQVHYTTVRSTADEQIWPQSSTALTGATNRVVSGLAHNDLQNGEHGIYALVHAAVTP